LSLLEVEDVYSGYGEVDVLQGVSLNLQEGELMTVIGPNGAGKTTLLRTITGVIIPHKGSIKIEEKDITKTSPKYMVNLGVSYVPQDKHIFPSLSVRENLEIGAYAFQGNFSKRVEEICEIFPPLKERMSQKAGTMSGGQQQMVALARGLMIQPDILLLDEPTAGLQPSLVKMILKKVKDINSLGVSVVLVAQTIDALNLAQRGYLLSAGEIILSGPTEDLLEEDDVQELYFGG